MNSEPRIEAFWITPGGEIIPVSKTHIQKVIENPFLFHLTIKDVTDKYIAENEELGVEGRAREQIIKELIMKKYIRIRYYPKKSTWTINTIESNEGILKLLKSWATMIVNNGFSRYDLLNIDLPQKQVIVSIDELLNMDSILLES
ncbi:MAG: hypothetical protein KA369_05730 [Spirochaetes bacterium]|nr:hypothetical protein [Spirochaetota bacterium]